MKHLIDSYLLASTDPNVSARITMQYYSSKMMKSRHRCPRLWLRLGNMVVLMSNCPKEETVQNMSLDMLRAIAIVRRYCAFHGRSLSRFTPSALVNHRMKKLTRIVNCLSTPELVDECMLLMDACAKCLPPFRYNLLYTPNVTRLAFQVMISILSGIDSYRTYISTLQERDALRKE